MEYNAFGIASAVISLLLSVVLGLLQLQWKTTMTAIEDRLVYERKRTDEIATQLQHQALQIASQAAAKESTLQRLEVMEQEFQIFRRELGNITQTLIRIETMMRKSTPPPRGG